MEIRNVQKTGDMHYVYLPTSWCREHKIGSKSKVSLDQGSDGNLIISPQLTEKKPKHLKFVLSEDHPELIHKLVVASYINPASSFEITLEKEMDFTRLLNHKRLISLESVEIDQKQITSDGAVMISDPNSLLKTMVKKIKNMILVMKKNFNRELIERYEDEIDRSKMLIDKAVIGSFMFERTTKLNNIELYYISLISKELERTVDHLIQLDKGNQKYLDSILKPMELLQEIIEHSDKLDQEQAMGFAKAVVGIKDVPVKDVKSYEMARMKQNLVTISEVIMDWMVTLKVEK